MKSFKDYYISEAKNTELNTFDEVLEYGWNYAKKLWVKSGFYEPRPSFGLIGSFAYSKPTEVTTIEKLGYPNLYVKLFILNGEFGIRAEVIEHGYNTLKATYGSIKYNYPLSTKDLENILKNIIDDVNSFYKTKGQQDLVKRYSRIFKEIEKSLRTTKVLGSTMDISNGDISNSNVEPSFIQFNVDDYEGTFTIKYIVDKDIIKEYKIIYSNYTMKGKTNLLVTEGKSIKLINFLILLNTKLSDIIHKFYIKEKLYIKEK